MAIPFTCNLHPVASDHVIVVVISMQGIVGETMRLRYDDSGQPIMTGQVTRQLALVRQPDAISRRRDRES